MQRFDRLRNSVSRILATLSPSDAAWRGAAIAVIAFAALIVIAFFANYLVADFSWQKLPAFPMLIGASLLAGVLLLAVVMLAASLPRFYRAALLVSAPFIFLVFAPGSDLQKAGFTAYVVIVLSLLGAAIAVFRREGFYPRGQKITVAVFILGMAGLLGGLFAVFSEQDSGNALIEDFVLEDRTLNLPNPGLPGEFSVRTTSYGSGSDLRRPDFGAEVGFTSRSVDGSKLIDNWDGVTGWLRSSYWGFDASELPLQARVWYPDGRGPFPLVLIVHGNHAMEDFSDPGYAYLGELFASRGIILASVDENFLNSSVSEWTDMIANRPGLTEENDARGWLLLQHLAQWRDWGEEPGHPFAGKVDMDRVALIGHSRGGEAVAVAAAFNSLARYPDDATLAFDFNFNLRGVIAIAPVDGQYRPRDAGTPIRNVNYFTIHGNMDGDVRSFDGTAQFSRVNFSGDDFRFKSSLYVEGANHGQFNTTWGNMDTSLFRGWVLDVDRIMDGEQQRTVAKVYFSAFMEVVLRDQLEYLPIFTDARSAANWLPQRFFINQYRDSSEHVLADFEEDIDPATMTLPGGRIETTNVSRWYEVQNSLKSAGRISKHITHAAVIAWDKSYNDGTPSLQFTLPQRWPGAGENDLLSVSIADAGIETLPPGWEPDGEGEAYEAGAGEDEALDWTVRLTDSKNAAAELPLSFDDPLYPQVQGKTRRAAFLDSAEPSEVLFRRFEFSLQDFEVENPALDATSLRSVEFVFDRSPKGAIIIDDMSLSTAFGKRSGTDVDE